VHKALKEVPYRVMTPIGHFSFRVHLVLIFYNEKKAVNGEGRIM